MPPPSHRRAPHPHIPVYMLMLMLTISKLWRTPHPHIALLELLPTTEIRDDGEHARISSRFPTILPHWCLDVMDVEYSREMKVVILKVQANTRQINQRLDTNLPELLGVTNTRSLKDEW